MFPSQSMNYDRSIVMFSPEGRLYQVEYATEAVRHGPLAVGVKAKDGVVLVGEKRPPSQKGLVDLSTLKKLLLVDDHVGSAIAGLHADARKLISEARLRAQINRLQYDEPITIQSLVVNISDIKQAHTQYGGARPFGAALIFAGVDDLGPQLYSTDPSGSFWGWKATAIGKESDVVKEFFKDRYDKIKTLDDALSLALDGVLSVRGEITDDETPAQKAETIEIGMIDTKDKVFRILDIKEVEEKLTSEIPEK